MAQMQANFPFEWRARLCSNTKQRRHTMVERNSMLEPLDTEDDGIWDDWDIGADGQTSGPLRRSVSAEPHGGYELHTEIAALRSILDPVIATAPMAEDPVAFVLPVTRLVTTIVQAIRAQRVLTGDPEDPITEAFSKVLAEMGLAEEM
jgi:hypothetical protein